MKTLFNARLEPGAGAITKVSGLMDLVDQVPGKKAIHIVSGAHNGTSFTSSSQLAEIGVHRYFLAAFMLTMRSGNHMLEYHYPTSIFFQYSSQAFFKEWDLNLGTATSGIEDAGAGVFVRKFQRGYVYWNPTFNNFTVPGGSGIYNIDNGQNIAGQVVPAKSGAFFVTQEVLNQYNTPPTPPAPPPLPNCQSSGGVCVNNVNQTFDGKTCSQSLNLGPTADCTGSYIYCFAANSCSAPLATPGPFTLNPPTTVCSGSNSHVRLSWTASPNGPQPGINSGYFVYVDGVYTYNALHVLGMDDPTPRTPGQTYRYKIEAVVIPNGRTFSNEQSITVTSCLPSPSPSPSKSPSPSPSPSNRAVNGDVDGSGTIDYQDYNAFVGFFKIKDPRANVNHDDAIDIFDYNDLLLVLRSVFNP